MFVRFRLLALLAGALFILAATACSPLMVTSTSTDQPGSTTESPVELAAVESIEIQILESFPVQVQALVRGYLPDSCTRLGVLSQERIDANFRVTIPMERDASHTCPSVIAPFEQTVALDVSGLSAGFYNVDVNGVEAFFQLSQDNASVESPGGESTEAYLERLTIQISEGQPPRVQAFIAGQLPSACTLLGPVRQELQGTTFVITLPTTTLPNARCAPALQPFEVAASLDVRDLAAGTYTVLAHSANEISSSFEIGAASGPASGPTPAATPTSAVLPSESTPPVVSSTPGVLPSEPSQCLDRIGNVSDITAPDGSRIEPGGKFVKTWRLRNGGDCTWSTAYQIVFVSGDLMGGPKTESLRKVVAPGDSIEVSIALTAPNKPGAYKGFWKLRNADGETFGYGAGADRAFWVQIVVPKSVSPPGGAAATPTPDPNKPFVVTPAPSSKGNSSVSGVLWHDLCASGQDGEQPPMEAPPGCVATAAGGHEANGSRETGEPGLAGVEVILALGACPGRVQATINTNDDGSYIFKNLPEGSYCISIDPLSDHNLALLVPGSWTYPINRSGRWSLNLASGQKINNLDFGWDFQFLP